MRISDWSSDVCSSDLPHHRGDEGDEPDHRAQVGHASGRACREPPAGRVRPAAVHHRLIQPMSIEKLLIANRGEIALRIHRAAHEMCIKPVAVLSTADADAMQLRLAYEAVCSGPPATKNSNLT